MTETTEPYRADAGDEDLDTTGPELAERLHGWALDSIKQQDEIRNLTARLTTVEAERDAQARQNAALLAVVTEGRVLLRERWKLRGWKGLTDAEILWLASADNAFVDSVVRPTEPAPERGEREA